MYALAFDIGTTTLAASLVDAASGKRLAQAGSLNPQRRFGADVITRLESACSSPETVRQLSAMVNDELQRLAAELLADRDLKISAAAFAGNPAMEHLLLGLSVDSLSRIPYRPLFTAGRRTTTRDLGWNLEAEAFVFPLPGGFVGGDLVAFLHGAGVTAEKGCGEPTFFLDLGTNGELALSAEGKLFATSAAAGPAFEGGNLSCGMPALPGAIHDVSVCGDRVSVSTIGGFSPVGLCGSGVIGAIAGLLRAGVIDVTGRLLSPEEIPSNLAVRVREVKGQPAFILHQDARGSVYLTQEDIRQVQLAKAAIRAGMGVLAARCGMRVEEVGGVVLTGSFGSRLSPYDLEALGVLAGSQVDQTRFIEEGALLGVERALCAPAGPAAIESLASACRVVPLSGNPLFEREFLARMDFSNN